MHFSGEMFAYLVFQISWCWRFPSSSAEQTFTEKGAGPYHSPVSVANIGWIITCICVDLEVCLMLRSLWNSVCPILHGHLATQFLYLLKNPNYIICQYFHTGWARVFLTVWFLHWVSGHMQVSLHSCDTVGREENGRTSSSHVFLQELYIKKSNLANEYNSGQSCLKW